MPQGFDTPQNITNKLGAIQALNLDFVARYLSQSPWKVIDSAEATAIAAAGLALVLVYEDGPTGADYFSYGRGQADGIRAAQQADLLGATPGAAIYFAVDYDASPGDITGVITQYFNGVADALKSRAAANNNAYVAGVYGSGATCAAITSAGLAQFSWLAQSRGWSGHDAYGGWSIRQNMPGVIAGLSVDPDDAIGNYGAVPPAPPAVGAAIAAGSQQPQNQAG